MDKIPEQGLPPSKSMDRKQPYEKEEITKLLQKMVIKEDVDKATGKTKYVAWVKMTMKNGTERTVKMSFYGLESIEGTTNQLKEVVKTIMAFQKLAGQWKLNEQDFKQIFEGSEWRTLAPGGAVDQVALERFNPNHDWQTVSTERRGTTIRLRNKKEKQIPFTFNTKLPLSYKHRRIEGETKGKFSQVKEFGKRTVQQLHGSQVPHKYLGVDTQATRIDEISDIFSQLFEMPEYAQIIQERKEKMLSEEPSIGKLSSINSSSTHKLKRFTNCKGLFDAKFEALAKVHRHTTSEGILQKTLLRAELSVLQQQQKFLQRAYVGENVQPDELLNTKVVKSHQKLLQHMEPQLNKLANNLNKQRALVDEILEQSKELEKLKAQADSYPIYEEAMRTDPELLKILKEQKICTDKITASRKGLEKLESKAQRVGERVNAFEKILDRQTMIMDLLYNTSSLALTGPDKANIKILKANIKILKANIKILADVMAKIKNLPKDANDTQLSILLDAFTHNTVDTAIVALDNQCKTAKVKMESLDKKFPITSQKKSTRKIKVEAPPPPTTSQILEDEEV